jgi:hypothetical protein
MTGDQYVNFVIKRLMGKTTFEDQFFAFLRGQVEDLFARVFTLNGTFGSSKVAFDLGTANKFSLTVDALGTDAAGHLLKIGADYEQGVQFENTNAIDYYVGLHLAERPVDIQLNPRTGYPEYTAWQEVIGERGEPDEVIDHGTYIEFRFNTVAGGVNEWVTGRKALVWKKSPAPDATSGGVGIEECDCVDIGGVGTGTATCSTTGTLGQTTVSTTASDYYVLMLGPTVRRYTDLSAEPAYWYLGTVTGGGAGSVPSGSDDSGQRLIEHSLSDVLAYGGGPAWKDGTTNPATTIEAQLDKIVTDLVDDTGTSGPNASGAHKIGAAAQAGSPESLTAGSIGTQLLQLLTWINTTGHIAVANVWAAMQTFSGAGTGAQVKLTPKSTTLANDGEIGYGTDSFDNLRVRILGNDRIISEQKDRSRATTVGLLNGWATGNWQKVFYPPTSDYRFFCNLDTNPHWVLFPLSGMVAQGGQLKGVRISAYTRSDATESNRMLLQIRKVEFASGTDSLIAEGYATNFTGTQNWLVSCNETFDSENYEYYVRVRCCITNSGLTEDINRGMKVYYTDGDYTQNPF